MVKYAIFGGRLVVTNTLGDFMRGLLCTSTQDQWSPGRMDSDRPSAIINGSRSSSLGHGDASDRCPWSAPGRGVYVMDSLGVGDHRTSTLEKKEKKRKLKNLRVLDSLITLRHVDSRLPVATPSPGSLARRSFLRASPAWDVVAGSFSSSVLCLFF